MIIDYQRSGGRYFWIRTADGLLSLLPEEVGNGYGIGYGGGGPYALAQYIQKLITSNGRDTTAIKQSDDVDDQIASWAYSEENARSQELTLNDLKGILR